MKLKLPHDWSGVTLGQFIQILDLPETDNKINDFIHKLAVLTGKDSELIKDSSTMADISRYSKRLAFLGEMPPVKRRKWFFWKWRFYKRMSLDHTTTMQVADVMQLNGKEMNEGQKVLNVLSIIYYRGKEVEYNADRFQKMKLEFENLPFNMAYSSSVFFLNGLTSYFPNVLMRFSKLTKRMTMTQLNQLHSKIANLSVDKRLKEYINGTISYLD